MKTKQIITEYINVLRSVMYTILQLYIYFVFCGLHCFKEKFFLGTLVIIQFTTYHILMSIKTIFYVKLSISEGYSTKEKFPKLVSDSKNSNMPGFNVFLREELLNKLCYKLNTCTICKTIKPPRAHHCKRCNLCYLKFDHHSIFLDICIGYHNYKYYCQFLVVDFFSLLFFIINISLALNNKGLITALKVNYIIALTLSSLNMLLIAYFIYKCIVNITNNETFPEAKALDAYLKGDQTYKYIFQEGPLVLGSNETDRKQLNPYNISLKQNWIFVFGVKWYEWFLPIETGLGNGTTFTKNYKEIELI